jgi:tetratricopeptide (TPR) repeat protein
MSSSAAVLKDQGNEKYKCGQYAKAVQLYSQAIELDPKNAVLFRQVTRSQTLPVPDGWLAPGCAKAVVML